MNDSSSDSSDDSSEHDLSVCRCQSCAYRRGAGFWFFCCICTAILGVCYGAFWLGKQAFLASITNPFAGMLIASVVIAGIIGFRSRPTLPSRSDNK